MSDESLEKGEGQASTEHTEAEPELPVMLDRAAILAMDDKPSEILSIPEWDGKSVRIKTMTGEERDAWEASTILGRGQNRRVNLHNIRASLIAQVVVDDAGTRLFSKADIEALGQKSAKALDRIFDVAQRLNGLRAEDIEDLAGNSEGDRNDDSGSD